MSTTATGGDERKMILVVDDAPSNIRIVNEILHNSYKVRIATSGTKALELASSTPGPDLILLDIGLPKLNGIEAARQIRRIAPKSKILFVSENRSWHIVEEALRSGGDGYVIKADAVTDLLPAVKAVLQGKRFVIGSFAQVEGSSTAQ